MRPSLKHSLLFGQENQILNFRHGNEKTFAPLSPRQNVYAGQNDRKTNLKIKYDQVRGKFGKAHLRMISLKPTFGQYTRIYRLIDLFSLIEVMWPLYAENRRWTCDGKMWYGTPKSSQGRFLTQHAPLIIARKYIKTFPNSPHNALPIFWYRMFCLYLYSLLPGSSWM
jgi:hypothetical protein